MADPRFCYKSITDKDMELFNKYKKSIDIEVRKKFPSISTNFDLKPVRARHIEACGTIHDFKIAVPENKFVKVSFRTGGDYMPPPDRTPDWKPPEPHINVDDSLTSTADE